MSKVYKCDICNYESKRRLNYDRHINKVNLVCNIIRDKGIQHILEILPTKEQDFNLSIMKQIKHLYDIKYENERNYDFVKWSSNILFCNLQMMEVFPEYLKHKEYKQQHKTLMERTFEEIKKRKRLIIIRKVNVIRRKVEV